MKNSRITFNFGGKIQICLKMNYYQNPIFWTKIRLLEQCESRGGWWERRGATVCSLSSVSFHFLFLAEWRTNFADFELEPKMREEKAREAQLLSSFSFNIFRRSSKTTWWPSRWRLLLLHHQRLRIITSSCQWQHIKLFS